MFEYIFNDYLQIPIQLVTNAAQIDLKSPILSYKNQIPGVELHFGAHTILFEKGIKKQTIDCF